MKRKILTFPVLLLIAGLLLGACGGGGATDGSTSKPGDDQPAAGGDLSLDPANATSENALAAAGYLYEGLVAVKDGQVVGALAESWTVSDDGLDYIFNLRSGVSFHDGTTLNADAVITNFNRWFDAANSLHGTAEYAAWTGAFNGFKGETTADGKAKSQYDGIEKVNELIVLVHLNTPDPEFLNKIAAPAFSIVSPAVLTAGTGDGGTNMYKVADLKGSTLKLEPFAGYWDATSIPSQGMEVSFK